MTDPQAAREQVARALVDKFMMDTQDSEYTVIEGTDSDNLTYAIAALLASTEVRVLEEVAAKVLALAGELTSEQADGCGNYGDVANAASNDTYRYVASWLKQQAQERTP